MLFFFAKNSALFTWKLVLSIIATCNGITDIKEMIVTHLTFVSLGTPISMKHQSDSAI